MESTIISKENIKPSSPTPHEKRIHKLSLIDQTIPHILIPIVFHYPNLSKNNTPLISISQTTQTLKQSLSSTLTDFYPLAGTFSDNDLTIDCNDNGPLFVVSEFDKTLTAFLTNPDLNHDEAHIRHLIPHASDGAHVLMIQSNHYKCGGVVLALLFYHHAADAISMAAFTKAWAAKAHGLPTSSVGRPTFPFHSSFPSNPKMRAEDHLSSVQRRYFKPGKTVVRRYEFDSSAISTLRARLPPDIVRPTRVELVTALLWKCFMSACATPSTVSLSLLTHSVDMRRRAEPRLHESSFGNFFWLVPASTPNDEEPNRDVEKLVGRVRSAMRKVDSGFIKAMEGEGGYRKNVEETWEEFPEEADYLAVTSRCGLGMYDVDFGWGPPVWITQCSRDRTDEEIPMLNALWLMDTREGGGVEAWMKVDQRYGPSFDDSEELRGLSKIGPSPLDVAGIVIENETEKN